MRSPTQGLLPLSITCALLAAAHALTFSEEAVAQTTERSESAGAATDAGYVEAARRAVAAFNRGDYAGAHVAFEQAHAITPSARTLRGLGLASFELGRFEDAARELTAASGDPRHPLTDEQHREVQALLEVARARLTGSTHAAQRQAPGASLPEVVTEPLDAARPRALEGSPSSPPPEPQVPPNAAWDGERSLAYRRAMLGVAMVGVAGVATGAALGLRSLIRARDRDELCPDGLCAAEDLDAGQDAARDAKRAGSGSSFAWAVGLTGLAGVVLMAYLLPVRREQQRAQVSFGPNGIRVEGAW